MQTNKTKNSTAKNQLTLKDVKEVHTWIDEHTIHIEEPDSIFPSVQWKAHQKKDK